MDEIQIIVSLVSGGLAGAAVNAFITSKKQKLDVTLSVIKDFFDIYEKIGRVKGIFAQQNIKELLDKPEQLFVLRQVGDWFHYAASLVREGTVNSDLLSKVGVIKEVEAFREAVSAAKGRSPEHLESAWSWWPNLKNFTAK